jgi:hypothetical protein
VLPSIDDAQEVTEARPPLPAPASPTPLAEPVGRNGLFVFSVVLLAVATLWAFAFFKTHDKMKQQEEAMRRELRAREDAHLMQMAIMRRRMEDMEDMLTHYQHLRKANPPAQASSRDRGS